jgi:hypothetical protein
VGEDEEGVDVGGAVGEDEEGVDVGVAVGASVVDGDDVGGAVGEGGVLEQLLASTEE